MTATGAQVQVLAELIRDTVGYVNGFGHHLARAILEAGYVPPDEAAAFGEAVDGALADQQQAKRVFEESLLAGAREILLPQIEPLIAHELASEFLRGTSEGFRLSEADADTLARVESLCQAWEDMGGTSYGAALRHALNGPAPDPDHQAPASAVDP